VDEPQAANILLHDAAGNAIRFTRMPESWQEVDYYWQAGETLLCSQLKLL
jgi:hypothetical protein